MTHFLNPQYLETLRQQRLQASPSEAMIGALRQLRGVNESQKTEAFELRRLVSDLRHENASLNQCLSGINKDYEEYRESRKSRQDGSLKKQMELTRRIQQLEYQNQKLTSEMETYKTMAEMSTSRSHVTLSSQHPSGRVEVSRQGADELEVSKQIQHLQLSNQALTKRILETTAEEASQIRSQMRSNNKQIASLRGSQTLK